ncbi:MAG: BlaI/MecI/CopY family transcriptional regulator [Pyrinomonadaceae bacterium]
MDIRTHLGRRERQIVDAVYRLRKAAVAEVRAALPDPPSYSAVRAMLNALEQKGYLRHERDGLRYVYLPVMKEKRARTLALKHLVATFFRGSPTSAAAALLEMSDDTISAAERARLRALISKAAKEER